MADYNTILIDSVYLTDDGLVSGLPCRTEVQGLLALRPSKRTIVRNAIDGTPRAQIRSHKGRQITITIETSEKAALDDLITEISTALDAGAVYEVTITGDTGNFDLDCLLVSFDGPGEFSDGHIYRVSIVLAVHTVNSITAGS